MKSLSFRKDLIGVQEELLRFAYKLTANREEANDLLQETSLKALDNEDKFMPDTNFKGWMYTIMRNIFINLKSATKLFSVLLASKRPLITELADKLRLKYPLLPTISPCPTM
ncbi:RNA polymerase sigma factor, partial [Bacteroides fragilis]